MSTIVCGVDRSAHARAAARLAAALARRLGSSLELVHVVPHGDAGELARARRLLDDLCGDLGRSDLSLRLEDGPPAARLAAVGRDAAALVVGTRGEGALRRALLGSVSTDLTRDPDVPVVVVPPGAVDAYGEPLARGGVVCGVRDDTDVGAACLAARMAERLQVDLTLVHVVSPSPIPISAAGGAPPAMLPRRADEEIAAAEEMLDAIARELAANYDCRTRLRVLEGPVGPQVNQVADVHDAALVVLGASDRGALAAALAGSPSRHVIRRGSQPVMVCPRAPGCVA